MNVVILVRHRDLESANPRVWKPMYKRLRGLAGKPFSHPLACFLPGLGWKHFDGKRFVTYDAGLAFEVPWERIRKFELVPGARVKVFDKREWWEGRRGEW